MTPIRFLSLRSDPARLGMQWKWVAFNYTAGRLRADNVDGSTRISSDAYFTGPDPEERMKLRSIGIRAINSRAKSISRDRRRTLRAVSFRRANALFFYGNSVRHTPQTHNGYCALGQFCKLPRHAYPKFSTRTVSERRFPRK